MSAQAVAIVGVSLYTPIYLLLLQSVPRKSGIGFVSRLRVHYATTDWSFWIEWMQAVFSIGTVVLYVVNSYHWEVTYLSLAMKLEVFFAVFYAFNFVFELLLSKNRVAYVMSLLGIVDLVTTVPVFVTLATGELENSPTGFVRFYRVLMLSRVFKPLRLMRAVESLSPGKDAVVEQTAKAIAYFVSTLFLATGLVQVLSDGRTEEWGEVSSPHSRPMYFHDALYFIIVTFSTVGYGDISPPDTESRLAIILLVGFFFFMIPRELNTLNQLLDLSSKYTGQYPKKLTGGHTIVGCDVATCGLVATFLEEFFHEDHGYNIMHLVLLVPHEPTMEWKRLVLKFAANDRVTYLKGDLRSTADLNRVSAHTAASCFILSNRHGNLKEEEKRGFMRAISVQDFNPNLPIFVEALTVAMRQRLVKVGINPARIVCASTINTRMLANACAWEGASTLINNLLVSASIDEQRDMPSWVKEYACGLGKEIYVVFIGTFAGRGFSALVRELFEQHGVVLLGISEDRRVVLHPGASYVITPGDLGFLVADDADVAESIVKQAGALLPFLPPKPRASVAANNVESPVAGDAALAGGGVIPRLGRTLKALGPRGSTAGTAGPRRSFAATAPGNMPVSPSGVNVGRLVSSNGGGGKAALRPGSPLSPIASHKSATWASDSASARLKSAGAGALQKAGASAGGAERGGYIVLVSPTLAQVSTLVDALEAPQVPGMGIVVVCPLHEWNQERDVEEIRRLRAFPHVRLVVGSASKAALRAAGANHARMVVVRAGKSFPEQETSDADADTIGQLVEVTAAAGSDIRTAVELNDMTYGNHYEILVDRLRSSCLALDEHLPDLPSTVRPPLEHARPFHYTLSATSLAGATKKRGSGKSRGLLGNRSPKSPATGSGGEQERPPGAGSRSQSNKPTRTVATSPVAQARGGRGRIHWTLSKGYASGVIVPSSLPETLLCQAFYNPAIIMIVEALLDLKAQGYMKDDSRGDDDSDGPGTPGEEGGEGGGGGAGGGGASFLAQIVPPKKFFTVSMLTGNRPNFQALMNFMLSEYDALPFALLRHSKSEGQSLPGAEDAPKFVHCSPAPEQKVMPLDKVFLLSPNLEAWERMKQDSPSTRSVFPDAPHLSTSSSHDQRGFPREQRGMPHDDRGFPMDVHPRTPPRRRYRAVTPPPPPVESESSRPTSARNLFPSPFGSAVPAEPNIKPPRSQEGCVSWATSTGRLCIEEQEEVSDGFAGAGSSVSRRGGRGRGGYLSPPQKGSHVKLDLLLREVQRLNGRLDVLVGRAVVEIEEHDEGKGSG